MNEKQTILDFLNWRFDNAESVIYTEGFNFIEQHASIIDQYLASKSQKERLCNPCSPYDPDKSTSSATKCKCGKENWEHGSLLTDRKY